MPRIFLSHSRHDSRQAIALRQWLIEQNPPLADEIYLDIDPDTGIRGGVRWKDALRQASSHCEAVICLLSPNWAASPECDNTVRLWPGPALWPELVCDKLAANMSHGQWDELVDSKLEYRAVRPALPTPDG